MSKVGIILCVIIIIHFASEADDDMIAISEKKKKKKQKKSKSRSPHLPSADITGNETVHNMSDKLPLKESTSSSSSRLSLDSVSDEGHAPMYVALTTSSDLISGEAMAAANATALVLSASCTPQPHPSPPHLAINSDPSNEQSSSTDEHVSHDQSRSPAREMRTAMLALSKMKDDLEVQNRYKCTYIGHTVTLTLMDPHLQGID